MVDAVLVRAVRKVVDTVGGPVNLSRKLKGIGVSVTSQAISRWKTQVPVHRVLAIEAVTGIPRHQIRPDLYPEPVKERA